MMTTMRRAAAINHNFFFIWLSTEAGAVRFDRRMEKGLYLLEWHLLTLRKPK